jgi:hypothetical protein
LMKLLRGAGLGWSVGGSGVITRATRGLPDDLASFKTTTAPNQSYRLETMPLTEQQQFCYRFGGACGIGARHVHLSIGDLSCRFFIGNRRVRGRSQESNIKVEMICSRTAFCGWLVTDAKGRSLPAWGCRSLTPLPPPPACGRTGQRGWLLEWRTVVVVVDGDGRYQGNKSPSRTKRRQQLNNRASEYVKLPLGGAPCSFERGYTFVATDATTHAWLHSRRSGGIRLFPTQPRG